MTRNGAIAVFMCYAMTALTAVSSAEGASTATMVASLAAQSSAISNIFGAAVVTQTTTSTTSAGTLSAVAYGFRNPTTGDPMLPDTPLRANTAVGELSVAVLVQRLVNAQVLPQLDSSIPTRFFPGGVQIINPSFLGVPLTLRMLLTHTSSIVDNGALLTSPTTSGTGSAQTSLRTYAEAYFLAAGSSGTSIVAADIWSSLQPGLTSTYQYARANVVLLSYILEQVIAENPTFVASNQKTVGAYLQESIFATLGMTSTFFVLPDGSLPTSSLGFDVFTNRVAAETSISSIVVTTVPLFAGYPADIMLRTSAADINKLMRALFLDSTSAFFTVGTQLVASLVDVTDTSRVGVTKQGFGLVGFDPSVACAAGASILSFPAGCSVTASTLYGIVGLSTNTAVTAMCTSNLDGIGSTCTSSVFSFHPTRTMTLSSTGFVAAAAAFNDLFIDTAVTEGSTLKPSDQDPDGIYGFFVFLGVLGASFGALFLAYIGEYILRPVPLIGPAANDAYPTLSQHIDRTNQQMMRDQQRFNFQ